MINTSVTPSFFITQWPQSQTALSYQASPLYSMTSTTNTSIPFSISKTLSTATTNASITTTIFNTSKVCSFSKTSGATDTYGFIKVFSNSSRLKQDIIFTSSFRSNYIRIIGKGIMQYLFTKSLLCTLALIMILIRTISVSAVV